MNEQMKQKLLVDLSSVSSYLNRIHVIGRTEMQYMLGCLEAIDDIATRIANLPEPTAPDQSITEV